MNSTPPDPLKEFKRPFYASGRFLIISILVLVVYGYGWRVTEIDLGELVGDVHLVKTLAAELVQPDLISADTDEVTVETGFWMEGAPIPPFFSPDEDPQVKARLDLSIRTGKIGDGLTVSGTGLPPNRSGALLWVNPIGQEFPLGSFQTGADGAFEKEIKVPPTARGRKQEVRAAVTWKTGKWHVSHTLKLTAEKMIETLFLALMATTMAILVAAPVSFLGARNLMIHHPWGAGIYYLVRTIFNVLRSIEPLVMAILFVVWVGIGPFAGVLALGVHSIAALGKLFSEQVESIDPGPVEAITATGATPFQVVLYAVAPQVIPQFLALSFYRWDINVRMSTIIGFVGGGGIGYLLQQWINLLQYNKAGTALLAIAVVVITLDMLSGKIRAKMV